MRIHFDGVTFGSHSGPNTFANRLATRLTELGHEVNDHDGPGSDVSLVFIEPTGQPLANRVVQRLDGLWFKPDEFYTKNVGIERLYNRAHAVVFQSDFDKRFTETHWVPHVRSSVIHNGLKVEPVKSFTSGELEALRNQYEKVFVCSANWHPQKRLQANANLFVHLKTVYPNSCFIVMGSNPGVLGPSDDPSWFKPFTWHTPKNVTKDVYVLEWVPSDVYMQIFSMADWMVHLAWLDHCPNVVVECLSQGTPVICSEHGGTKELVGGYGLILRESKPYENTLADYDNPPPIDVTQVKELPAKTSLSSHADITIERCTDEYLQVFKSVLEG